MQKISNPIPIYLDARGALLDGGKIYLGQASADPEVNPIVTYWDSGLTQVAEQPLRTIGGRIVNGASPATVFIAENDYSMRICDSDNSLVDYSPSVFVLGVSYQPLDSDLTAIAALGTSEFGRSLLALANQAALRNAVGYPQPLPIFGGTVTGDIVRAGLGGYPYWGGSAFTGGAISLTNGSASDPTVRPGDIWFITA